MRKILLEKKDPWARIPVKAPESNNNFNIYNSYTTKIPKKRTEEIHTGLILPKINDRIVLCLGQAPKLKNKMLEVKRRFVGMTDEISYKITNCGQEEVTIEPFICSTTIVILKCSGGDPKIVDELDCTERGESGFGSTGTV